MSESGTTSFPYEELWTRPPGKTDWARFDALTDEDIARAVADDPDAARLDIDWSDAKVYFPRVKQAMSLRVDPDVVAFFKAGGKGYQTRMNAVLRAYVQHKLAAKPKK